MLSDAGCVCGQQLVDSLLTVDMSLLICRWYVASRVDVKNGSWVILSHLGQLWKNLFDSKAVWALSCAWKRQMGVNIGVADKKLLSYHNSFEVVCRSSGEASHRYFESKLCEHQESLVCWSALVPSMEIKCKRSQMPLWTEVLSRMVVLLFIVKWEERIGTARF